MEFHLITFRSRRGTLARPAFPSKMIVLIVLTYDIAVPAPGPRGIKNLQAALSPLLRDRFAEHSSGQIRPYPRQCLWPA